MSVPWDLEINFASALLLHSCNTVLIKEGLNLLALARRASVRWINRHRPRRSSTRSSDTIGTSAVLDAYTSLVSRDLEGELSELYFTNTGLLLMSISLASSVAMNILLDAAVLNGIVVATFGLAFAASLGVGERDFTLPIFALRRAGRFIWSDTPVVNFFSLIYIATVRRGDAELRLQDYVVFRTIAVLELVFMKAKLAASRPHKQVQLLRQLVASELVLLDSRLHASGLKHSTLSAIHRDEMVAFTTAQRLSVMLIKTAIGHEFGSLRGRHGPVSCQLPAVKCYVANPLYGWTLYRLDEDVMFIEDCLANMPPQGLWGKVVGTLHGVLLRQLGKVRVIYLLRDGNVDTSKTSAWHSNINLVTGVSKKWIEEEFKEDKSSAPEVCILS